MNDKQVIVSIDQRLWQAHMLRNRLAEAGIEAFVVNDNLTRTAVGLPLGWTSGARVVVAEHDADAADAIARQFEAEEQAPELRTDVPDDDREATAEPLGEESLELAQCPACGRPRMAVCPVCQTARADFPPADPVPGEAAPRDDRGGPVAGARLLICTACDEPFAPGYLARCEWCGHDFGTGIRPAEPVTREPMDSRVVAAVLGVSLGGLAILAYFAMLLSR